MRYNIDMNSEQLVAHWVDSSERDFVTMDVLFKNKRYMHSLFWGHLIIEKLLKALYAKTHPEAPYAPKTHDVLSLAKNCNVELDVNRKIILDAVNSFNIEGRYEDEKKRFYKLCTKEFTTENIEIIKELREWIKSLITK